MRKKFQPKTASIMLAFEVILNQSLALQSLSFIRTSPILVKT